MTLLLPRVLAAPILPILVVIIVPYYLLNSYPIDPTSFVFQILGILIFFAGLFLAVWCMLLFLSIGGTIMPWDPTRELVAVGPYQYARNPMISGVTAMLAGEALFFGSLAMGLLAVVFFLINHFYFIYSEEPGLEKRFGEAIGSTRKMYPVDTEISLLTFRRNLTTNKGGALRPLCLFDGGRRPTRNPFANGILPPIQRDSFPRRPQSLRSGQAPSGSLGTGFGQRR